MCELLSNNSQFVCQLYEDKSLALHARDLIFTTDLQTVNYYINIGFFQNHLGDNLAIPAYTIDYK